MHRTASRACDGLNSGAYLGDCVLDHLLVGHITLVAYKQLVDALGGVSVNLLEPLLDVVEAVHIRDIVDDTDAVGATVVGRSNGAETFLAGGIPLFRCMLAARPLRRIPVSWEAYDLELHCLAIELDRSDFLSCC